MAPHLGLCGRVLLITVVPSKQLILLLAMKPQIHRIINKNKVTSNWLTIFYGKSEWILLGISLNKTHIIA